MSFIRMGQEGSYVDIPGGSDYYLYDNGNDIEGWSYGEFAALIGQVVDEIDLPEDNAVAIKSAFRSHFEGWDPEYRGGITPPERAEIFCQCVDSRIDGIELSEELHEAVREWAESFEALRECKYCGKEFRPYIYNGEPYICNEDECSRQEEAERYGVTLEEIERDDRIFNHLHYDYGWDLEDASHAATDYLLEQSPKSFDTEAQELAEEMSDD